MTPDVHTLTGAYALHALDDVERRLFERHLAECANCATEVDELRATAAQLGMAVAQPPPPDQLRQRVLDRIATTRQEPPRIRASRVRPRPPRWWTLRVTAVAATVAVAAAVALGLVTVRTHHELDTTQAQLDQVRSEYRSVAAVLAAPDVRTDRGAGTSGGTVVLAVSRHLDEGVLLIVDPPVIPAAHQLQAWVTGNGNPRSIGLIAPTATATTPPLTFTGLGGANKLAVTIEPAGGSRAPTTAPVILFDLPA